MTRLNMAAHQMLFLEGDSAEFVYNVTDGAMKRDQLIRQRSLTEVEFVQIERLAALAEG